MKMFELGGLTAMYKITAVLYYIYFNKESTKEYFFMLAFYREINDVNGTAYLLAFCYRRLNLSVSTHLKSLNYYKLLRATPAPSDTFLSGSMTGWLTRMSLVGCGDVVWSWLCSFIGTLGPSILKGLFTDLTSERGNKRNHILQTP